MKLDKRTLAHIRKSALRSKQRLIMLGFLPDHVDLLLKHIAEQEAEIHRLRARLIELGFQPPEPPDA